MSGPALASQPRAPMAAGSTTLPRLDTGASQPATAPQQASAPGDSPLKVRVLTWNMHGTIPKGDLAVLFGHVGVYPPGPPRAPCDGSGSATIPPLPLTDEHPYHIVVIACQECPWGDGGHLTAGLHTAGEIGSLARARTRRDRRAGEGRHRTPHLHAAASFERHPHSPSPPHTPRTAEGDPYILPTTPPARDADAHMDCARSALSSPLADGTLENGGTLRGWSKVCDDWLARGAGVPHAIGAPTARPAHAPSRDTSPCTSPGAPPLSPTDMQAPPAALGPYRLVAKERMMGCYTAVYMWRGCLDCVRGVSSDVVKSGLLAGRMGNKGGIGISIHVGELRLLFVNAHLAAHANRLDARVENAWKIATGLHVDTFLPPGDPRNALSDVCARFDYCFWCGDLNYISRRHAEWLIQNCSYDDALSFDQLGKVLKEGTAFQGFHEAPITFPPTYKYDIEKAVRQSHRDRAGAVATGDGTSTGDAAAPRRRHRWRFWRARTTAAAGAAAEVQASNAATLTRSGSRTSLAASLSDASDTSSVAEAEMSAAQQVPAASAPGAVSDAQRRARRLAYDSSAKQRVPSWCDRVLWRSAALDATRPRAGRESGTVFTKLPGPLRAMAPSDRAIQGFLDTVHAPIDWLHSVADARRDGEKPAPHAPARAPASLPPGAVSVLAYHTVDDGDVEALGARSDHRPVLFTAAVAPVAHRQWRSL
ncbi:hypothetical protein MSPP1_001031 [Malassezia sp. CBS 17886]|nr:hypothetical protein MSPP1_001031 [Malassezia sp. CBS 17886]